MNDIVNLEASDMFHLPPGIEWPFTLRSEPANLPVVLAAISGEGLSESELYTIGYYAVRNKMGGLKGVQIPHPFGGKFRQMMVYVDPAKLQAHHLSTTDVVDALRKSNLVLAAGTARMGGTDYQIHPRNTLPTPADIEAIPIAIRDDRPIFIRDVAKVVDDAALQYNIVRVNGKRSVYCPLLREPGENTIAVVDRIYEGIAAEIPKMKERGDIPEATEVTLVSDQSSYIRNAMSNLYRQVGLGALLVAVVVFVFLRGFLPTVIIVATIVLGDSDRRTRFCLHRPDDQRDDARRHCPGHRHRRRCGNRRRRKRDPSSPHGQIAHGRRPRRNARSLRRDPGRDRHDAGRLPACRVSDRHDQVSVRTAFVGRDVHHRGFVAFGVDGCPGLLCHVHSRSACSEKDDSNRRTMRTASIRAMAWPAAQSSGAECAGDRAGRRSLLCTPAADRHRTVSRRRCRHV